jgi:hypothetical protein
MRPGLTVAWLPKDTPEFNAIEPCWQDLKGHFLGNCSTHPLPHIILNLLDYLPSAESWQKRLWKAKVP